MENELNINGVHETQTSEEKIEQLMELSNNLKGINDCYSAPNIFAYFSRNRFLIVSLVYDYLGEDYSNILGYEDFLLTAGISEEEFKYPTEGVLKKVKTNIENKSTLTH